MELDVFENQNRSAAVCSSHEVCQLADGTAQLVVSVGQGQRKGEPGVDASWSAGAVFFWRTRRSEGEQTQTQVDMREIAHLALNQLFFTLERHKGRGTRTPIRTLG